MRTKKTMFINTTKATTYKLSLMTFKERDSFLIFADWIVVGVV